MLRLLAICVMLLSGTLYAQVKVTGVVMEETTGGIFSPLVGVNVYWIGSTSGTSTNADGFFEIEQSQESRQLVFSYIGFQPDTILITRPGKLTVVLKNALVLDEFQVVHRRKSTTVSFVDPLKTEVITERELFKAACCNLSESFETNPSVDVSFTDAITGSKQIQMLGLTGSYVQVTREQMPFARGLSTNQALTFIPGSWISSIQVSKGTGSVVNGYESIAGQINTELKSRIDEEHIYLNGYLNESGRSEINLHYGPELSAGTSTNLLLHASANPLVYDMNMDGFADNPTGSQLNLLNRWQHFTTKGWEFQAGIQVLDDQRNGGQLEGTHSSHTTLPWLFSQRTSRAEGWLKAGYVFPNAKYKSFGFQASGSYTETDAGFGSKLFHGEEKTGYFNFIYQSIIKNTNHKFRTGASLLYDDLTEQLAPLTVQRKEIVPGSFFEYTYTIFERFNAVAGVRADYHNLYGPLFTPRMHLRYALNEFTVLRGSIGKGYRVPTLIGENLSLLAGNRTWYFEAGDPDKPYGFVDIESAWTTGLSLNREFRLDYRDGNFSVDAYHSFFENQLVTDLETPGEVHFYNLKGRSYATSLQGQLDYELIKRLDVRLAYRYYDVKTQYNSGLLEKPLVQKHRAFINLGYEHRSRLKADLTVQWHGVQRIPGTSANPPEHQLPGEASPFFTVNAQLSKELGRRWEVYAGMENITDYKLSDPIISAHDPESRYFDSSLVWGPVFGRMAYAGFRFRIKHEH